MADSDLNRKHTENTESVKQGRSAAEQMRKPCEEAERTETVAEEEEAAAVEREVISEEASGTQEQASEEESKQEEQKEQKEDTMTVILEYVRLILTVVVISLLITNYVLQRNTVKGSSMVPTLRDGDELFVEKVTRYFGDINRFDIITVDTKGLDLQANHIIKRVIGLPGETVEIKDNQVYINGELLEQPFLPEGVTTLARLSQFDKVTLGEDEYYCMGDNRLNSNDSRNFGPVPLANVMGKLLVRFYPFDRIGVPK